MKKTQKQYLMYALAGVVVIGLTLTLSQSSSSLKGSLRDLSNDKSQNQLNGPSLQDNQNQQKDGTTPKTNDPSMLRNAANKPIPSHIRIDKETLPGGSISAGTYEILRFNVAALKGDITFNKAPSSTYSPVTDNLIAVKLNGYVKAGDIGTCTLKDATTKEILDTLDLSTGKGLNLEYNTPATLDFNFSEHELKIPQGQSKKLSVVCDLALTVGESVSASIPDVVSDGNDIVDSNDADNNDNDVVEPTTIVYNVGSTVFADPPGEFIAMPIIGPAFAAAGI